MISATKFCIKTIHSNAAMNNFKNLEAQSRMLRKLMNKSLSNRRSSLKLTGEASAVFMEPFDRRKAVFNKVYMEHLTQVMESGKNSKILLGLGIEISKVQIVKGLKHINVYWISKNDIMNNKKIEQILTNVTSELQNEISSLRYVGKSPEIRFIRDLTFEREVEVSKLLAEADYGKDFKPSHPATSPFDPTHGESYSDMKQDILGLDHAKMKEKILAEKKKQKTSNKLQENYEENIQQNFEENSEKLVTFDKKIFHKFYHKKRIDALKEKKRLKALNYNKNLIGDEEEYEESECENFWLEDDYIEDYTEDIYDEHLKEYESNNDSK